MKKIIFFLMISLSLKADYFEETTANFLIETKQLSELTSKIEPLKEKIQTDYEKEFKDNRNKTALSVFSNLLLKNTLQENIKIYFTEENTFILFNKSF